MTYWTLPMYARAEWLIYINKEYVYMAGDEYGFFLNILWFYVPSNEVKQNLHALY